MRVGKMVTDAKSRTGKVIRLRGIYLTELTPYFGSVKFNHRALARPRSYARRRPGSSWVHDAAPRCGFELLVPA